MSKPETSVAKRLWSYVSELSKPERAPYIFAILLPFGLLLVTLANSFVINSSSSAGANGSERRLASVAHDLGRTPDAIEWEKSVAEKLLGETQPTLAAVGNEPTPLDALLYGTLAGHYAVRTQDGKIQELSFATADWQNEKPKLIVDRSTFLAQHRLLLPVTFKSAQKVMSQSATAGETYELLSADQKTLAKVHFKLDDMGRMLAMTVETLQKN